MKTSSILREAERSAVVLGDPLFVGVAREDPRVVARRVKKPETIKLPDVQAERDGLFCAKILGQ